MTMAERKRSLLPTFLAIVSTLSISMGNESPFLSADKSALLVFKAAITDPYSNLVSWTASLDVCHWRGIVCSTRNSGVRVTHIDISNLSLSGNLTQISLHLPSLEYIDLSQNSFYSNGLPFFVHKLRNVAHLSLSGNLLTGQLDPGNPTYLLRSAYFLNISDNSISGSLPHFLGAFHHIVTLDLSHNHFGGSILPTLAKLTTLTHLSLAHNNLEGLIPPELAQLPNLTTIDLSGNLLYGPIPPGFETYSSSSFLENANLCGPPLSSNCLQAASARAASSEMSAGALSTHHRDSSLILVAIIAPCALSVLFFVGVAAVLMSAARKNVTVIPFDDSMKNTAPQVPQEFAMSGYGRLVLYQRLNYVFGIEDILDATENFDVRHLIGTGSFGSVYSASLAEGNLVLAVKRLIPDSKLKEVQFQAQLSAISQMQHRNLVPLMGLYSDAMTGERLLLTKHYPGGNLWVAIQKKLDWSNRLSAALSAAMALRYLHSQDPPMVHNDFKPENVLLDENLEAYVADYGLAQLVKLKSSSESPRPSGSLGYLPPEYVAKQKVSVKADVFAFGVLLLQLVTGRSPTDPALRGVGLPRWAMTNSFAAIIDPSLDWLGDYKEVILGVLRLGILCSAKNPEGRPDMADVELALTKLREYSHRIEYEVEEEYAIEMS